MWAAARSKILASSGIVFLLFGRLVAMPPSNLKVEFVRPSETSRPGDSLALSINGAPPGDAELRIYGLVNHSPDRKYENNQTILLAVVSGRDLLRPSIPVPKSADLIEVTAVLTGKDGSPLGAPARLSLTPANTAQAAPTTLLRLMNGASAFLDRLVGLYDSIRSAPEDGRAILIATLEPGKSPSVDILALDRAQYRALALSSDGNRIAWTVEQPEGFELWTSTLTPFERVRLAASSGKISSPQFVDQHILLYLAGTQLMAADTSTTLTPRRLKLPFASVSQVFLAQRDGSSIKVIARAQHPDAPGIDMPYTVRISADESEVQTVPLADNSFYESYSQFIEGAPFFFAGSVEGSDGIYSIQPSESAAEPKLVFKVQSPGLVAASTNGKKLAFAGNP